MKMKAIVRKILCGVLAVVVIVFAAIPFAGAKGSSRKIRLVVDFHGYTPSTSRIATAEDPDVFNSTYYIAEAFMEENPDVEIVWARTKPVGGMDAEVAQWFTTQIAGGTVPAIAFSWGTRYQDRDWYLPLDEYLVTDYPYEEKFDTWKEVFRDYLWKSEAVVNARGEVVGIPITLYPGAATGYFYNKTAFSRSGISSTPRTWNELISAAEKLKENGYIGVAPWSFFTSNTIFDAWVWGSVIAPSFGGYVKNRFGIDYDGDGTVSSAEQARATLNGYFSTSNAYARDAFYLLKAYYTQTLEKAWSSIEYYGDWLDGNVGIREEGIWAIPTEDSVAKDFDYGVFVAPYVTKDSSYSVREITSSGGGKTVSATCDYLDDIVYSDGPFEPTPDLVVNVMKSAVEGKPEVLDAAIRFLKYVTKPENVSMICIENAGVIGASKGTGHSALIDAFLRQKFPVKTNASFPSGFTDRYGDVMNRRMEEWINGRISDEEFFRQADICNEEGAKDFVKKMGLDVSSWEPAAKEKLA